MPIHDRIFGLAASIGLGLIAFCLPVAAFLALPKARALGGAWTACAALVLLLGAAMMVISTVYILVAAAKPKKA